MGKGKKIIVAISGASGSIYARMVVERLVGCESIQEIALIFSHNGKAVMEYEGEQIDLTDGRIKVYDNNDMFSSVASGSADYDAMVIVPCSMGCIGRIASGVSTDLISRSADVILKEQARLIVVPRETPLNVIHLRNLTTLAEAGVVVLPAMPSFYSLPKDIENLSLTVVERIIKQLGVEDKHFSWQNR